MTKDEMNEINIMDKLHLQFRRICAGAKAVKDNPTKRTILLIYIMAAVLIWVNRVTIFDLNGLGPLSAILDILVCLALAVVYPTLLLVLLVILGTPPGSLGTRIALYKAGLTNHIGQAPILLTKLKGIGINWTTYEFDPCGIPMNVWLDSKSKIEVALNINIISIAWGADFTTVIIDACPAATSLPTSLVWRDEYLSPENFVLVLGQSVVGLVTINLARIPHILLGGSTGSGKSFLLKSTLLQSLKKGAVVCIADFKGGVDFVGEIWNSECRMCFDILDLLTLLTELVDTLESRKVLFRDAGCHNIDAYNEVTGADLKRYIFACDEVAELLDKTGLDKAQKELVSQVESKLATIARQGRAFGIHLILATQRPDANILPGQIKNNMDCRICGRADNVLSQIILDNTDAASLVPKDIPGRFLTHEGMLFQAFYLEEND